MTPYGCYCAMIAMRAHFQSDKYDIFKFKGKTKTTSRAAFEKRGDRHRIEKMARNMSDREILEFFLANFTRKINWMGLFDEGCDRHYNEWKKHNEALSYNFGNEFKKLLEDAQSEGMCYNDVFVSNDGQHPPIFTSYIGGELSLETFVILNRINSFTDKMVVDIATEDILRTARKYDPFIKVDMETYDSITKQIRERVFN